MNMADIEKILDAIEGVCEPTSIFLYGSRARTDATEDSDYEIGVLLPEDKYVGRSVLRTVITEDSVSVFPFHLEQFQAGNPDTHVIKPARSIQARTNHKSKVG